MFPVSTTPVSLNVDAEYGRIKIFADVDEITKDNVLEIFSAAFSLHIRNAVKEAELFEYEKGKQDILNRKKAVRSEINEKIVINKASQILDVHVGYSFGNPVTYVQRGKIEQDLRNPKTTADEDNEYIAMLNKMMAEQAKPKKDIDLARDFMTCGLGYQMVWKNDDKTHYSPFKIATLNPLTTFMVYKNDAFKERLMGCSYITHTDGSVTATAYTKNKCFVIKNYESSDSMPLVVKEEANVYGEIPIVEFENTDRMGVFEKVISILNEANVLNSDRLNDVAQHVQSLLWMHNCEVNENTVDALMDKGVVSTKSNGEGKEAKIAYLSQILDQSQVQTFADFLYRQVEEITSTPSWQEASGGSTTGAMQLSNGWQSLELSAKSVEQNFQEPERQILRLVSRIIELDGRNVKIKKVDVSDIEISMPRNKNYDLVSKANALATMLNVGVDGLWAYQTVGLFSDSEQAWIDSKETVEQIQKTKTNKGDKDAQGRGGENNEPTEKAAESLQPSAVAMVENS